MENTFSFHKFSGNGNDFVILDHPSRLPTSEQIQQICHRHFGVGADGVLILSTVENHDGQMRIFNADGTEAEMCGNGLRCLVTYLNDKASLKKDLYKIKTMNGSYVVTKLESGAFAIEMSEIKDLNAVDLTTFNEFQKNFYVNTGVPHLVFLGHEIKRIFIKNTAPKYRYHSLFPNGTNVDFVEVLDAEKQTAYVRTYERGVEDETLSCGTGLTATGLALSHWFGWKGDITLMTLGGKQIVHVGEKVLYSGEVKRCFAGEIKL